MTGLQQSSENNQEKISQTREEWLQQGAAFIENQQYDKALSVYDHLLQLDPDDSVPYYKKGTIYLALERYADALTAYEETIPRDPNNAFAYNNKGVALAGLQRNEEALLTYHQALSLNKNFPSLIQT